MIWPDVAARCCTLLHTFSLTISVEKKEMIYSLSSKLLPLCHRYINYNIYNTQVPNSISAEN